mmetsp:Transcript_43060/g.135713  ORF Transcript_43060/g.135713 Transcript_43060/m.135713 type:complete len:480 (-) Transcript_43060:80-1519(-)
MLLALLVGVVIFRNLSLAVVAVAVAVVVVLLVLLVVVTVAMPVPVLVVLAVVVVRPVVLVVLAVVVVVVVMPVVLVVLAVVVVMPMMLLVLVLVVVLAHGLLLLAVLVPLLTVLVLVPLLAVVVPVRRALVVPVEHAGTSAVALEVAVGAGLVARVDLLELRTLVTGPGHRITAAVVALRVAAALAVALQRLLHHVLPPGLLRHGALDVASVVVPALRVAIDDGLRLVALLLDDGPRLRALLGASRVGAALRLAGPHAAHGLEPTVRALAMLAESAGLFVVVLQLLGASLVALLVGPAGLAAPQSLALGAQRLEGARAIVVTRGVARALLVALEGLLHLLAHPPALGQGALHVASVVVATLFVALCERLHLLALLLQPSPAARLAPTFEAEGLGGIGDERGAAAHEDGLLAFGGVLEEVLPGDGARQEVVDLLGEAEPREGQEPQARQERDQAVPEVHGSRRTNRLLRKRRWQTARCRC